MALDIVERVFDGANHGSVVVVVEWKWDRLALQLPIVGAAPLPPAVRRDVEIHHESEAWTVEARQGGVEGESKRWVSAMEDEATKIAEQLMRTDE